MINDIDKNKKYTILSGIKPTGKLTLGNYLGAIKQFVKLQRDLPNAYFLIFIADLHATTMPIDPSELRSNSREIAAIYLASGLDPKRTSIFLQSEVLEHANLGYLMESTAYIGEMERMIQFKEKKAGIKGEGVRTSLLTYPALMAADILLYNADFVPIGQDQKQHLELTELLAKRFNKTYGDTFKIPQGLMFAEGKKIKSLQDPSKKMSKSSDNEKSYILLLEPPEQARKKIMSAVTDSDQKILYNHNTKPGLSNLIDIFASLTGTTASEVVTRFYGKSYKEFKTELGVIVGDELSTLQANYRKIISSQTLDDILDRGAKVARKIASQNLTLAKKNMGLTR